MLGSFNTGGAQTGRSLDAENHYELQNSTSIVKGAHTWKFGVRTRGETDRQHFAGRILAALLPSPADWRPN